MTRKSDTERMIRKQAGELDKPTADDLGRLRDGAAGPIDTSEIPERRSPARGRIRSAVIAEIGRRRMSGYALWKEARQYCNTLPQSAVYEFLRNERQIGLEYVEAIIAALDLNVIPAGTESPTAPRSKQGPAVESLQRAS